MNIVGGTLGTSKATILTCTTQSGWRIKFFSVVNGSTAHNAKITLWFNKAGTSLLLTPVDLELAPGAQTVCANDIILNRDDYIEGKTNLAGSTTVWQIHATEFQVGAVES